MQGEELYTSGRKWVFYITSRKLFSLPLQIKWSLQRNFLLSALRSEKKKCFCVHILVVMLWLLKVLKAFLLQVNALPMVVDFFPLLSCPQKSAYSKT